MEAGLCVKALRIKGMSRGWDSGLKTLVAKDGRLGGAR